ncbi:thioredoxin-like protein [Neoconidiobolus thromboides FSU 785]|nr:thioredoxin-like protein [Neoconidiobolus thromboides FSU 785]
MVKEVKTFDEFKTIIEGDKLVVVDFHAQWCGPCKVIAPQFQTLSEEQTDVEFIKIDVDAVPEAAQFAGVTAMPTFKLYKSGEKVSEVVGANINLVKKKIGDAKA